jgi:drug/metabolite transporter (DMT)-like permease
MGPAQKEGKGRRQESGVQILTGCCQVGGLSNFLRPSPFLRFDLELFRFESSDIETYAQAMAFSSGSDSGSRPHNSSGSDRRLLGVLYVLLGSASYGMLSTFVKLSYKHGYTTAEVTTAQFFWGVVCLSILNLFGRQVAADSHVVASSKDRWRLMVAGISVGLTSCLYYVCVKYINASVAVVLLMQSVWIGVVVEAFQTKRVPAASKIVAVVMTLIGTILATDILNSSTLHLDLKGVIFGFLAAISFSVTLYSSNSIANHLPAVKRSLFMLFGGSAVVIVFAFLTQLAPSLFNLLLVPQEFVSIKPFDLQILFSYGFIVAIFGTVIPPILLNRGFPITGVGLGSILSAVELPFAIIIAFTFLSETINASQWLGVLIILTAIVLMNYRLLRPAAAR